MSSIPEIVKDVQAYHQLFCDLDKSFLKANITLTTLGTKSPSAKSSGATFIHDQLVGMHRTALQVAESALKQIDSLGKSSEAQKQEADHGRSAILAIQSDLQTRRQSIDLLALHSYLKRVRKDLKHGYQEFHGLAKKGKGEKSHEARFSLLKDLLQKYKARLGQIENEAEVAMEKFLQRYESSFSRAVKEDMESDDNARDDLWSLLSEYQDDLLGLSGTFSSNELDKLPADLRKALSDILRDQEPVGTHPATPEKLQEAVKAFQAKLEEFRALFARVQKGEEDFASLIGFEDGVLEQCKQARTIKESLASPDAAQVQLLEQLTRQLRDMFEPINKLNQEILGDFPAKCDEVRDEIDSVINDILSSHLEKAEKEKDSQGKVSPETLQDLLSTRDMLQTVVQTHVTEIQEQLNSSNVSLRNAARKEKEKWEKKVAEVNQKIDSLLSEKKKDVVSPRIDRMRAIFEQAYELSKHGQTPLVSLFAIRDTILESQQDPNAAFADQEIAAATALIEEINQKIKVAEEEFNRAFQKKADEIQKTVDQAVRDTEALLQKAAQEVSVFKVLSSQTRGDLKAHIDQLGYKLVSFVMFQQQIVAQNPKLQETTILLLRKWTSALDVVKKKIDVFLNNPELMEKEDPEVAKQIDAFGASTLKRLESIADPYHAIYKDRGKKEDEIHVRLRDLKELMAKTSQELIAVVSKFQPKTQAYKDKKEHMLRWLKDLDLFHTYVKLICQPIEALIEKIQKNRNHPSVLKILFGKLAKAIIERKEMFEKFIKPQIAENVDLLGKSEVWLKDLKTTLRLAETFSKGPKPLPVVEGVLPGLVNSSANCWANALFLWFFLYHKKDVMRPLEPRLKELREHITAQQAFQDQLSAQNADPLEQVDEDMQAVVKAAEKEWQTAQDELTRLLTQGMFGPLPKLFEQYAQDVTKKGVSTANMEEFRKWLADKMPKGAIDASSGTHEDPSEPLFFLLRQLGKMITFQQMRTKSDGSFVPSEQSTPVLSINMKDGKGNRFATFAEAFAQVFSYTSEEGHRFQLKMKSAPADLNLQAKRFYFEDGICQKDYASFEVPESLLIPSELVLDGSVDPHEYELDAIIWHEGTPYFGHYVFLYKNEDGHWVMINDDKEARFVSKSELDYFRSKGYLYHFSKKNPLAGRHPASIQSKEEEQSVLDAVRKKTFNPGNMHPASIMNKKEAQPVLEEEDEEDEGFRWLDA